LISPRHVLTAYHCTYNKDKESGDKPCDHSDGKRLAVLGQHEIKKEEINSYYTIPIIEVKYPPNQLLNQSDTESHDLAMLILKEPAVLSKKVSLICLPNKNEDFSGQGAIAAGWGRTDVPEVSEEPSPLLKYVKLQVSRKKFKHKKMFGTELEKLQNRYQDPCSGDSGDIV
jgi:hypothetical protein